MRSREKWRSRVEAASFWLALTYLLGVLAILWAMWVGGDRWWWGTALLFAPRWPWLVPGILLAPLVFMGRRCRIVLVGIVLAGVLLLGVRLSVSSLVGRGRPDEPFTVATMNVGGSQEALYNLLSTHSSDVDAIFLQEANSSATSGQFPVGWSISPGGSGLSIISPHPMSDVEVLPRPYMPEWGASAVRCVVSTEEGAVRLVGVHLRTPRDGVDALIGKKLRGVPEMQQAIFERSEEARAVRNWIDRWEAAPDAPMIVAGDFNTPVESWLYQRYWGDLSNAFGETGAGLGYTKRTRWHGIRIDHVLGNDAARIQDCQIGENLGSDHRPVLVTLDLVSSEAGGL